MRALKRFPLLLAVALTFGAQPASAVLVGDPVSQPILGQPLDIRIPVTLQAGDDIDDNCVSFARVRAEDGLPLLGSNARIRVLREQGKRFLQIITPRNFDEPFVRFIIQVNCGQQGRLQKEYTLLLDPPEVVRPAMVEPVAERERVAKPLAPTVRPKPKLGETWEVGQGDTLAKLAKQVYPRSRKARAQFVIAAAKANNLPEGANGRLPVGTTLRLPDHQAVIAEQLPIAEPTKSVEPVAAVPAKAPSKAPSEGDKDYKVKLATVNLENTKPGTEKDKLLNKERQLMAQSDDQTAQILALRNQVRLLETRLAELNERVSKPGAALPAEPTAASVNPVAAPSPLPAAVSVEAVPVAPVAASVEPVATPVPSPVAAPLPAPVPAAQSVSKSESDTAAVQDNTMLYIMLAVGAGVVGVFVLLFMYLRGGRQEANYSFGDAGGEREAPAAPVVPRSPVASPGLVGDVRPVIDSAQQMIERGQHEQALDLLLEQIDKTRHEVKLWMLMFDILKQLGRKADFQSQAIRFRNHFRGVKLWQKVQAVGHELDPHNPLYMTEGGEPKPEAAAGGFDLSGSEIGNKSVDLGKRPETAPEDKTLKLAPGTALGQELKSALMSKREGTLAEQLSSMEPVILPPDSYENPDIELTDEPLVAAPADQSVAFFDLTAPPVAPAPDPAPVLEFTPPPAPAPAPMPEVVKPPVVDMPVQIVSSPITDETMVNLGIDLDAALGAKFEDEHEAATKLDLAKVYREMGANDLAIDLLKEAVRIGTAKQREEAANMLAGLQNGQAG